MDSSQRNAPCDLCGGIDFEIVSQHDRRRDQLTTVSCVKCGLVSHESIPSDAEIEQYYADDYRSDYHGEFSPSAYRVVRAWNNGHTIYRRVKRYLRPNDRVFEIGAGIGCTVKKFELAGYRSAGVEPGVGFNTFSKEKIRANVAPGKLTDLPAEPICDMALLIHVIEHFNCPSESLRQIHSLIRPGGRIYIECPNVGAPHAAPKKLFHYAHIYNFTHQTLRMLAEANGFELSAILSREDEPDIRMLFSRSETSRLHIEADSYHNTIRALTRFNTLSYHCRIPYIASRIGRLARLYSVYFGAKQRQQRILEQCAAAPADCDEFSPVQRARKAPGRKVA